MLFLILLYQNLKVFPPMIVNIHELNYSLFLFIPERRQIRKAILISNNRMKFSVKNVPKPNLLAVLRIKNQLICKDRLKDHCIVHILPTK